jgi:hypothetical protein
MKSSNEVLQIKSTSHTFFQEYLTLKKPVIEAILSNVHKKKVTLNPKLLNVFALLLYFNHKYKDLEEDLKWEIIFSNTTKEYIMNELHISKMHLNTYLSILRSLKLLDGNKVNKLFIIYPNGGYDLTFKFTFNEE